MRIDKPSGSIKHQSQTSAPTTGDATLVDDPVALVDDPTALVGGNTTLHPDMIPKVKTINLERIYE
jgi:hypothetical protein